ncbi:RHS repeat-associated core domain-containing protein [Thalassococcus sp. S3]|uniref:RHS repeat-associated core domain-containing protein n=1 Tax=Thalassococcus sp. S3 TaxID=2017482 RepID=UPI00102419B5|nr:AHH domain-containing protein [Thalassococcus sp. S3]QBF32698.1 hypothetical protein CFI11_15965 [Thalassococcus sp. S3]
MHDGESPNDEDVTVRDGGTPDSEHDANATGRTATGAGGPETLADWITAFDDYQERWEDEKEALEDEVAELEAELAAETDPVMRDLIQSDLNAARIDLSVIDAEYGGAFNPYESGTGQWEVRDFREWADQMQMDPTNPAHAEIFNQQMGVYTEFNENLVEQVENDHWFYYNILGPADWILQWDPRRVVIRRVVREIAERGARAGLRRGARGLTRGNRTARVNSRRSRRNERRNCRRGSNPFMLPTGVGNHEDPHFVIPGLIELSLQSVYWSDIDHVSSHGSNRIAPYDAEIRRNRTGGFDLLDDDGYRVSFPAPTPIPDGWVEGNTVRPLKLMQVRARALLLRDGPHFHHFDKGSDGVWRISRIYDGNDNTLHLHRDAAGQLDRIDMPERLSVAFTYEDGLRTAADLLASDGDRKRLFEWHYDERQNMTDARCLYGEHHRFVYDDQNRIVGLERNGSYSARYTLDEEGRRLGSETSGPYDKDQVRYDAEARKTIYMPAGDPSRAQTFHYNENDNITAEENALGHVRRYEENAEGFVSAEIDPLGHRIEYRYDADGNLKSVRDPLDRFTYVGWTDTGALDVLIDPAGGSWEYDYDARGNLVSARDPLGHVTDLKVSDQGQVTGVCRHDGMIRTITYDEMFRPVSEIDFNGRETTYTRDAWGRVTSMTDDHGATTRFEFKDQPGLDFWTPARTIRADGTVSILRGDGDGRTVETVDRDGHVRRFQHDAFDNLIEMTDPKGGTIRLLYTDQLELDRVINQAGEVWQFERDAAGRIVREIDFAGFELRYEYDAADRLVVTHFPDGRTIRYEWDAADQMIARIAEAGDGSAPLEERFEYDARGMMCRATGPGAVIEMEYDALGNQIAEVQNGQRIERGYDCCGNVIERRIADKHTEYTYSPTGQLTGLRVNGADLLTIGRDSLDRPVRHQGANGYELSQDFDDLGQLVRQIAHGPEGFAREYTWSRKEAPSRISDPLWGSSEYESDANGQVTRARHGDSGEAGLRLGRPVPSDVPGFPAETLEIERFSYKATLDVEAANLALPQMPLGRPLSSWRAAPGGRTEEAAGLGGERVTLRYDSAGRVIQRSLSRNGFRPQSWTFEWDAFDRMVACVTPEGARWEYTYDPLGRRIEKRSGESVTRFLWDGDVIAVEASDDAMPVHWHFEPGTFIPLLREAETLGHVVTDHLGTPREIVDAEGALLWSASYRLWGKERGIWGDSSLCPIRFPGQWHDDETGLHYNRFRYYDPLLGQYLSVDPSGLLGGLRSVGYVDCALTAIDPLGLNPLRGALTGLNVPWQAHHIIPIAVWNRPANLRMMNTLGLNLHNAQNGVPLPTGLQDAQRLQSLRHRGPHPRYSNAVERDLDAIRRQWESDRRSQNTRTRCNANARARASVIALQARYRGEIAARGMTRPGATVNEAW